MDLMELIKGLNIPEEELQQLTAAASDDPMAAMGIIQKYMTPEMMQQLMMQLMSNPGALNDLASQAGMSEEQVDELTDKFMNDQ